MTLLEIQGNKNLKTRFSGMDSIDLCRNKDYFKDYNKIISYEYNSRGFRDKEWPDDLKNKIWCVGDSFTAGIGQPHEETWPSLLEKKLNERCLNVSEDGCSNDLIALRAKHVIDNYQPKAVIIMWSYFWRRFINGKNVHFNPREMPRHDVENFLNNLFIVNDCFDKIINLVIPDCFIESSSSIKLILETKDKKNLSKILKYFSSKPLPEIIEVKQIDYARDGHHFDKLTCEKIVEDILAKY